VQRDLRLAFRRAAELGNPLAFFAIVATLFPLALAPASAVLPRIGVGVLWVAALLSSVLALASLFQDDLDDGSLDRLMLAPVPLEIVVLARIAAHWLVSAVPLVLIAPAVGYAFQLPPAGLMVLWLALLLATPTLSMLGAIGAALTVGLRRSGSLLGLLVLPLMIPVLIFGARATDLAAQGEPVTGPLYLLAALAALALTLGPIAATAALRVALE
jgi:heme exporter protein B